MDILKCIFGLFYIFYLFKGYNCAGCTKSNVDKCWEPVDKYLRSEGKDPDHSEFALFQLSNRQLKSYCHLYENSTSDCLASLKRQCTFDERKIFEGTEDALDFFCGDGFNDYLKHKDCIGSDSAQNEIHQCTDEFERDYNDLLYSSGSHSEAEDKFCDAVYDSIDCDKEAIEDLCGDDAGEWVEKYELALYEPYMDQFNCKRGNHVATITGIIIAVVVVLIFISCIVTCWLHHKKQKQIRSRRYMASQSAVVYNNSMAGSNAQPQVGFVAASNQGEKGGIPANTPVQTPPYPGVFTQPSPPPPYYPPSAVGGGNNTSPPNNPDYAYTYTQPPPQQPAYVGPTASNTVDNNNTTSTAPTDNQEYTYMQPPPQQSAAQQPSYVSNPEYGQAANIGNSEYEQPSRQNGSDAGSSAPQYVRLM